jgi:hypothetical protein
MDQSTVIAIGIVKAVLMLVVVGVTFMGLIWLFSGVQSLSEKIGQFIVRKWKILAFLLAYFSLKIYLDVNHYETVSSWMWYLFVTVGLLYWGYRKIKSEIETYRQEKQEKLNL